MKLKNFLTHKVAKITIGSLRNLIKFWWPILQGDIAAKLEMSDCLFFSFAQSVPLTGCTGSQQICKKYDEKSDMFYHTNTTVTGTNLKAENRF